MARTKDVLTTGEVARICKVAPRTVSKWFDSGELKGYRIPGSKDRRVPVANLVSFMRQHGIPVNALTGPKRVLICSGDTICCEKVTTAVEGDDSYVVECVSDIISMGAETHRLQPSIVVVDETAIQGFLPGTLREIFLKAVTNLGIKPQVAIFLTSAEKSHRTTVDGIAVRVLSKAPLDTLWTRIRETLTE